jgi:transposase InsO family protein
MKEMRLRYPIPQMCRVLGASASGYYRWLKRKPSKRAQEEGRLEVEIKAAHQRTRETFGPERLQRDLAEHGVKAGVCRIRRIRKKLGIRCKQKKKFKATTDSKHTLPVAENLVNQQFKAAAPNQIWVTDITYIPTEEGWRYPPMLLLSDMRCRSPADGQGSSQCPNFGVKLMRLWTGPRVAALFGNWRSPAGSRANSSFYGQSDTKGRPTLCPIVRIDRNGP